MGTRKKKQSPKKPRSSTPAADPAAKKRLDTVRRLHRERVRSLNSMTRLDPLRREAMDCDEIRAGRRMTAAVNLFDAVASVALPLCPDVERVSDFEFEWLSHSVMPRMGFDWNERICNTVLAGAMWMLDRLRECGALRDAWALFPRGGRSFGETDLPDVRDASHGEDALSAMVWIIRHRNDNCTGIRGTDQEMLERPYMDLYTASNRHRQEVPSRQLFEQILAMIPPQEIERAVQLFEQTWWELVRRYYTARAVHAKIQQDIDARFDEYHSRTAATMEEMKSSAARIMQQAEGLTHSVIQGMQARQSNLPVHAIRSPWARDALVDTQRMEKEHKDFWLRIQQFQKEEEVLNREQQRLEDALVSLVDTMGGILAIPRDQRREMYFPEAAAVWEDFTVSDPYTLCFGFLYLLDRGSDLPWIYAISLPLMEQCASVLPWRYAEFEEDPEENRFGEERDAPVSDHQASGLPGPEDWYGILYEIAREDAPEQRECRNLAQIVYSVTGSVMPRNLTRYENALNRLDSCGISDRMDLRSLLYCMTMLGELRHRSHVYQPPEAPEDISENVSVEVLRQKLRALQAENEQLRQTAYEAGRETRELHKRLEASELAARADRQELADLRSLIFNSRENAEIGEPIRKIHFPYTAKSRIVVFGGHDAWAREIKPRLPNVRFIDRTMLPNAQLIRQADTIWIQTNALSHSFFYKIIAETRRYGIPVRYFSYAGAEKCAEQLALADMG